MLKTLLHKFRAEILSIAILITVPLLIYFYGASIPSLFGDEWRRVYEIISNNILCPHTYNIFLRPFWGCHITILHKLFGLNTTAFHFTSLFLLILESISFFLVLNKLFPKWKLFSLFSALLFYVYPSVFSHLWFESNYHQLSLILFLISLFLLIEFYTTHKKYTYILGIFLLTFSIILYESNIGLVLFLSFLAFFVLWKIQHKVQFSLLVPAFIAIIYSVGRWISQLIVKTAFGHNTEHIYANIPNILHNYYYFLRFELQWAWTHALKRLFPYNNLPVKTVAIVLLISVLLFFLFVFILKKIIPDKKNIRYLMPAPIHNLLILGIISFLISIISFIPSIFAIIPEFSYVNSHINLLPNLGASMFVITCLSAFVYLFKLSPFKKNILATSLFVILFFIASYTQITYQKVVGKAWDKQKEFWSDLFVLAPDIEENTSLIVIIENFPYNFTPEPFIRPWGFKRSIKTLYGNENIKGYITYYYENEYIPKETGFFCVRYNVFIPYDSVVLMIYDYPTGNLYLDNDSKYCQDCILPRETTNTQYRYLVR